MWIGPVRINHPRDLTPMWPFIRKSADEYCNPVLAIHLWPIGGADIWYKGMKRTEICDECKKEYDEQGICYRCHAHPCSCDLVADLL